MDANVKEWLTSPVVAGRLDEIGRSLERRRVIKEEEEIRYPITTNVFRTLNAARRGVGAGVNTLLGTLLNDLGGRLEGHGGLLSERLWGR